MLSWTGMINVLQKVSFLSTKVTCSHEVSAAPVAVVLLQHPRTHALHHRCSSSVSTRTRFALNFFCGKCFRNVVVRLHTVKRFPFALLIGLTSCRRPPVGSLEKMSSKCICSLSVINSSVILFKYFNVI